MLAVPIILVMGGYWILYSGVKGGSLLDAYRCTPAQQQTPIAERSAPGSIVRVPSVPGNIGTIQERPAPRSIPIPGFAVPNTGFPIGQIRQPQPVSQPRLNLWGGIVDFARWTGGLIGLHF
jgi:hypothetical protein